VVIRRALTRTSPRRARVRRQSGFGRGQIGGGAGGLRVRRAERMREASMPQDATAGDALGRSVLGGAACGLSFAGASCDALARAAARREASGARRFPGVAGRGRAPARGAGAAAMPGEAARAPRQSRRDGPR
jgi:hypothetical protein